MEQPGSGGVTAAPPSRGPGRRSIGSRYIRTWRLLPRQAAYLVPTALIGLVVFGLVNRLPAPGGPVSVLVVLLLALLLLGSRSLGRLELARLRAAVTPPIPAPRGWQRLDLRHPLQSLGRIFADGHYWAYGLHSAVANPLLAAATAVLWLGPLGAGLLLVGSPGWNDPVTVRVATLPAPIRALLDPAAREAVDGGSPAALGARLLWGDTSAASSFLVLAVVVGTIALLLVPVAARAATLLHWGLARLLLSRFPSEDLRRDVARIDAARAAAVRAEDTALRRLERDIHDGPQQRLLRLQMELSAAERRMRTDPEAAAAPVAAARRMAAEALDELRALSRGVAPPILQDRGLAAALEALGDRGPVRTDVDLAQRVPDAIERSVYFVAAELVANALKHGEGAPVVLRARSSGATGLRVLTVVVEDGGPGGARMVSAHGLAGVEERLAGLGGVLQILSPEGGPTVISAEVPLR